MGVAAPADCVRPGGADGDTYPRRIGNNVRDTNGRRVCECVGDLDSVVIRHRDCKSQCNGAHFGKSDLHADPHGDGDGHSRQAYGDSSNRHSACRCE